MRICIIAEGSYPYVTGGVSSWIQSLIKNMPEYEFVIYAIGAEEKARGKFNYDIPKNVLSIEEIFLDSALKAKGRYGRRFDLTSEEKQAFKALILNGGMDIKSVYSFISRIHTKDLDDFFMSKDLFDIIAHSYKQSYAFVPFTEFFWNIRSIFLPLFNILKNPIPEADIYHSVSTGYAGIIGGLGKIIYNKPFILTEHGIYTREREEEIIKSLWIKGNFKDLWINFFYNLSKAAYDSADKVITLFEKNKEIEVELGCREDKIEVIPNGVSVESFKNVAKKEEDGFINIGAVVRVVPIKDIKTMIQSFALVKSEVKNARFYIMGPTDENEEYYEECKQLVEMLEIKDVIFTGKINVDEYIGKMDLLVLSSISEGQPLVILEGFALKKPFVCTNVGSCKELLYGVKDEFGRAGYIVPIMNYEKMAQCIIKLCKSEELRKSMGEKGYNRVKSLYTMDRFIKGYKKLYEGFGDDSCGRHRL